jgi:hypothetical protein
MHISSIDTVCIKRSGCHGTMTPIKNLTYLFKTLRQGSFAEVDPTVERLIGRPPTTFAHFANEHAAVWQTEPSPQPTRNA